MRGSRPILCRCGHVWTNTRNHGWSEYVLYHGDPTLHCWYSHKVWWVKKATLEIRRRRNGCCV